MIKYFKNDLVSITNVSHYNSLQKQFYFVLKGLYIDRNNPESQP